MKRTLFFWHPSFIEEGKIYLNTSACIIIFLFISIFPILAIFTYFSLYILESSCIVWSSEIIFIVLCILAIVVSVVFVVTHSLTFVGCIKLLYLKVTLHISLSPLFNKSNWAFPISCLNTLTQSTQTLNTQSCDSLWLWCSVFSILVLWNQFPHCFCTPHPCSGINHIMSHSRNVNQKSLISKDMLSSLLYLPASVSALGKFPNRLFFQGVSAVWFRYWSLNFQVISTGMFIHYVLSWTRIR